MTYQQQIDHILDHFNFAKVHVAMTALNWTWISTPGVPEESDLRIAARKLLFDAIKYNHVSAGGFTAILDSEGYLQLFFRIDEVSANPEC